MQNGQDQSNTLASNRLWLIISLVIAVTVIAVMMVPEADRKAEDIPPPVGLAETPPAPVSEMDESIPATEAVGVDADTSAIQHEGDAARTYLAQATGEGLAASAVYAKAQEFRSRRQFGDAWLLYFKAAKDGHAEAAMALAEQADPRYFKADETVLSQPDVVQAHKWYLQAQRNGSEQAGQRLQQLLADLEKSVQADDEQAAVLLETWKSSK